MILKFDNIKVDIDRMPDTCPICHHAMEPKIISHNIIFRNKLNEFNDGDIVHIFYRCPKHDCQYAFIGEYWQNESRFISQGPFILHNIYPRIPKPELIDPEIMKLSSKFSETYKQSSIAEQYMLNQISGIGYRKSLEFLVKDFCIYTYPDKIEEIKSKYLGECINDFIDDTNIRNCAKLASWLGNDETHYTRIWEDKDINDLKILINLTLIWIRSHLLTQKYLKDMKKDA